MRHQAMERSALLTIVGGMSQITYTSPGWGVEGEHGYQLQRMIVGPLPDGPGSIRLSHARDEYGNPTGSIIVFAQTVERADSWTGTTVLTGQQAGEFVGHQWHNIYVSSLVSGAGEPNNIAFASLAVSDEFWRNRESNNAGIIVVSTAVGAYATIVGAPVSAGLVIVGGSAVMDVAGARGMAADGLAVNQGTRVAITCDYFRLDTIIIADGSATPKFLVWPSSETHERVEHYLGSAGRVGDVLADPYGTYQRYVAAS